MYQTTYPQAYKEPGKLNLDYLHRSSSSTNCNWLIVTGKHISKSSSGDDSDGNPKKTTNCSNGFGSTSHRHSSVENCSDEGFLSKTDHSDLSLETGYCKVCIDSGDVGTLPFSTLRFPPPSSRGHKLLHRREKNYLDVLGKENSCDYQTVQEVVNPVPDDARDKRFVIRIKAGVYEETIGVPLEKRNVVFLGDGIGKIVITASLNNTVGPDAHQAVAYRSTIDLSVIENCEFIGNQDTLYAHGNRQFYK
ncbi:hypothetical protein ACFX1X_005138 [Malus domestica]|uniref:Pectinesterase catalytic domain-containing protein n=1 Tax=Malus domestica TaxID=3750 RepID=A0A498IXD7_MALDO|nr:hypothetical protein DVH24_017176 [Malus domestica]